MRTIKILIIAVSMAYSSFPILSQEESNPLDPIEPSLPQEIGLVFGLGTNIQSGTSLATCEDCEFENGNKFGYTIGLVWERFIAEEQLKIGLMGLYDNLSISSTFREREAFEFEPDRYVPVNFRHYSDINVASLSIVPFIKWTPTPYFFVKVGPNFSYLLNVNLEHRKEILDKSTLLPTGETVSILFPDTKKKVKTIEDEEYKDINKLQIAASLMTGFNFEFGYDFVFSPYFMYNMPITNISDYGKDFKISSWRIMFEFRIKI